MLRSMQGWGENIASRASEPLRAHLQILQTCGHTPTSGDMRRGAMKNEQPPGLGILNTHAREAVSRLE